MLIESVQDRESTEHKETHQNLSGEEEDEESLQPLKLALEEANQQKRALQEEVQTLR